MNPGPGPSEAWKAHPTAIVEPGARIGEGTSIWHWTHVMPGARIGRRCSLGQNVFVGDGATLGDGVRVQNNVSIYDGVELGDDVFCGPSAVFTNVANPRSHVPRKHEFRPTRVGKGATLGANCTVVCGHDVGRYAFVAAGAVVTRDVPEFALAMGVPARVVGWVCRCGVRLGVAPGDAAGRAACRACGAEYEWDGLRITEAR